MKERLLICFLVDPGTQSEVVNYTDGNGSGLDGTFWQFDPQDFSGDITFNYTIETDPC